MQSYVYKIFNEKIGTKGTSETGSSSMPIENELVSEFNLCQVRKIGMARRSYRHFILDSPMNERRILAILQSSVLNPYKSIAKSL